MCRQRDEPLGSQLGESGFQAQNSLRGFNRLDKRDRFAPLRHDDLFTLFGFSKVLSQVIFEFFDAYGAYDALLCCSYCSYLWLDCQGSELPPAEGYAWRRHGKAIRLN